MLRGTSSPMRIDIRDNEAIVGVVPVVEVVTSVYTLFVHAYLVRHLCSTYLPL